MICKAMRYVLYKVTSRLFTHIVSTEKMRKDIGDRKYMSDQIYLL